MYDVSGQVFPKFEFMQSNCSNDLPSESIGSIIKDKEGFIWLASWDGLCRYDGKNLVVFKNDPLNANTIAENKVGFLVEDNESNIWVSHLKGISCYIKKEGKFKNYKTYINVKGDTLNIEYGFMRKDASGNIYCTEMGGIYNKVFDKKKNTFRLLNIDTTNDGHNNKNASNKMVGVLSDIQWDGSMYLQSSNGTFLYNPKTNIRKRVCNSSTYTPLTIFKDYKKQLWLAEWNAGLSIINEQTKEKQLIIPNNRIHHLLQYKDANGMYWLLASDLQSGNIFIINPITKAYTSQVFKLENAITANATPANLYQDVEGKLYVTSQMGLVEATHTKQYINTTYTYDRGKPADLFYKNLVRSGTQQPNGNYIVGLVWHNGLRIYDSNLVLKKTITNYLYNEKNYDLDVRNFTNLGNDKFLMSGFTGFAFLDKYKITPIKYVPKKDEAKDTLVIFVRETLPINENEYWVRILRKGVYIFNTKTAQFGKQYLFADKAKKIPFKDIITIAYDDTKQLWVLDVDHLYKYNRNTDNFDTIPVNQNNKYLSAFNHMHIAYGNIWITGNGGLLRYNIETQKQTFYAPSSGLPNDVTYKAVSYNEETICILLEVGVSILNTTTGKIINFNAKNGLSTSDMEFDAAFFIDHSKNLIVGNNGILTKIDVPHLLKLKTAMPTLAITEVKGNDSTISIFINNKNEKQTYLDFKNFPVNINFSIIDFSPKGDRKYFYRYTGKDTTWIPCTDGVIPINTIEPGDYTLQVTGSVNGVYADKIEQITFTILPRWHQSWWFKLLAGILLFTGISSLYKWRINTAKASQKQQTEIQRLAAQEYKNQLELAQISNYFSTSLINLETEEEVLWDVAKNLIGKLGFEDCIIYLWNKDKTKLVQRAGYGPKGSIEEINKQPFDVVLGQGVVGYVAQTKEPVLINDTRIDARYRVDEMSRLSEICVPILHENELVGVIDSEHTDANFYTQNNLQSLISIGAYLGNKLADIKSKQAIKKNSEELQKTLDLLKGAQLEALRSQMNPHFIFNCLNSIKLYTTQNDTVAASNYLTKFSKLIRLALENSKCETIPLSTELKALELYIQMEAMRFKDKLKYSIVMNDNVDADFIEIPPLLLQPYVENSIWHGLMHKEEGGRIDVHISIVPQKHILEITIKDDGVGREKAAALKSKSATSHKSFGTKVTSDRLEIVNQLYKTGASVHTEDVMKDNEIAGTLVTIMIPYE